MVVDAAGTVAGTEGDTSAKLEAIEQCATFVAINGPESESSLRTRFRSQPEYEWLMDSECMDYRYFRHRVNELQSAANVETEDDGLTTSDQESTSGHKKRKSRWGSASDILHLDADLVQYAIRVFGTVELEGHQWRQLSDQRNMRILTDLSRKRMKQMKEKYDYDSDEDVDGGTWEHKRRMQEMEKTKERAHFVTESNQGKHHIGDFLPPDELSNFLRQWQSLKEGKSPALQNHKDYDHFKRIASDNIGFQMMQRMGWTDGQSLGADSTSGITQPITW